MCEIITPAARAGISSGAFQIQGRSTMSIVLNFCKHATVLVLFSTFSGLAFAGETPPAPPEIRDPNLGGTFESSDIDNATFTIEGTTIIDMSQELTEELIQAVINLVDGSGDGKPGEEFDQPNNALKFTQLTLEKKLNTQRTIATLLGGKLTVDDCNPKSTETIELKLLVVTTLGIKKVEDKIVLSPYCNGNRGNIQDQIRNKVTDMIANAKENIPYHRIDANGAGGGLLVKDDVRSTVGWSIELN